MNPSEIFPDLLNVAVVDTSAPHVNGNPTSEETEILCRIAKCLKADTVFEIGTYNGSTADHLAANVQRVITLDLPIGVETRFPLSPDDLKWRGATVIPLPPNVVCLYGDSATVSLNDYYDKIDLVFVMGAHTVEYTESDLRLAKRLGQNVVLFVDNQAQVDFVQANYDAKQLGDTRLWWIGDYIGQQRIEK